MSTLFAQHKLLLASVIVANIALTVWCFFLDPIINYDGVIYVTIAELFLQGDWHQALEYYHWPFYSLLISGAAKVLFIDAELAAHAVNALFIISICFAYLAIVADLSSNNKRLVWIAALIIVFFPSITKYRSFVIRDFAYLSCYLWSLRYLLRYCHTHQEVTKKRHLMMWFVFSLISILFRIEGVIFIFFTPYLLFILNSFSDKNHGVSRNKILKYSALLIVLAVAFSWWYLENKYLPTILIAQALGQNVNNLWDVILMNMSQASGQDKPTVWQALSLLLTNIGLVIYEVLHTMAFLYALLVIVAYKCMNPFGNTHARFVWLSYLLINIVMLIGFAVINHFFVSRYGLAIVLTLLILAPFGIHYILDSLSAKTMQHSLIAKLMVMILVLIGVEGLNVKTDKHHFSEAADWIKHNIPLENRIYANNKLLIYYSERGHKAVIEADYSNQTMQYLVEQDSINHYHYLALSASKANRDEEKYKKLFTQLYGEPIYYLENKDKPNRSISIFKTTLP